MKRQWHPLEDEEVDLGAQATTANPMSSEVNANKRTRTNEPAVMVDVDRVPLSHTHTFAVTPVSSSSFVNMSIIHGPDDMRPQQPGALPGFPYKPLKVDQLEIRVVILRPGVSYSPIICDLIHVATANRSQKNKNKKRGSPVPYTALSYMWGPPSSYKTITLDGIEVQVRKNLWQALQHLRSPNTELHLWIDAICIDQDKVLERNQQVSRMGTIYGLAKEVIVWLGPEEDESRIAMDFIEKTTSVRQGQLPSNHFVDHLVSSTPVKQAISKIMERDYWKRAWIIQEIFRARKIALHCGSSVLSWTCLAKFFRLLRRTFLLDVPLQISLLNKSLPAHLTRHRTSRNHNLERLLETYKRSECSDPRDRIFSLIGLAGNRLTDHDSLRKKEEVVWISVDYSKSLLDLFRGLVMGFTLYNKNSYTPLQRVHFMESGVRRMHLLQEVLNLKFSYLTPSPLTQDWAIGITCGDSRQELVSCVSPPWSPNLNDPDEHQNILDWHKRSCMGMRTMPSNLEPVLYAFPESDSARVQEFQFQQANIPQARFIDTNGHTIPILAGSHEATPRINSNYSARFFTTAAGRLGIAPLSTELGDTVYRFFGCDIALIVRMEERSPRSKTAVVIGRSMILKSEREIAWEAGSPMAELQYAVPDDPFDSGHEITLPLEEWRSLTW